MKVNNAKSNRNHHFRRFLEIQNQKEKWDVVIIGGGITGAGIALGCAKNHLKTLLIEAKDFGYSSSGNSSKLVHGGLRYIQNGQFHVTFRSVREREKLLKELPYLIWPISFVLPYYSFKDQVLFKVGLSLYDLFAGKKYHKNLTKEDVLNSFPFLREDVIKKQKQYGLRGGYIYQDAQTDDVRLLIRTLKEAEKHDAVILNYIEAKDLIIENNTVRGVILFDAITQQEFSVRAKIVINATGFLVDFFRQKLGLSKIMRPLRGSHIVLSQEKLPIKYAMGFKHPIDKRNIFVLPWLGKTVVGTTDMDHKNDNPNDNISISTISKEEIEYLLQGIQYQFPEANITSKDIYSTWSGVRPVVSTDSTKDPSKESRDIFIEFYKNLLTITGGKLTTFRIEAKKVLKILKQFFKITDLDLRFERVHIDENDISLTELKFIKDKVSIHRFLSFYGKDGIRILKRILTNPKILTQIEFYDKDFIYEEELKYSLEEEWVLYYEDLFYRRFRFGIVKKDIQDLILNYLNNFVKS